MVDFLYPVVVKIVKGFWSYLGLQFHIIGEPHIPRSGSAIMSINHVGYLDFALAGTAALPANRYLRFMAKKQIFDHPIAGPLMRGMHHISVDRSNGSPSFVAALRALDKGELVGIFPEATISRTFELKEMKSGVIRLAAQSGAPIIPMIIWGSQRVWTKRVKKNLKRNNIPITIAIGEPYTVAADCDIDREMEKLRQKMESLLTVAQRNYPDIPNGQFWAPPRLGGCAPTADQLAAIIAKEQLDQQKEAKKATEASARKKRGESEKKER
jgi:1-acyl-sn-glycerol-3-phosphate acyltransferase